MTPPFLHMLKFIQVGFIRGIFSRRPHLIQEEFSIRINVKFGRCFLEARSLQYYSVFLQLNIPFELILREQTKYVSLNKKF